ncbi:23S rRNA pseudouridine1911/1915/1917 synthase [Roseateles sp. YR242]|uniref:RluA family pseudouridine synthase n=1 Tax=Roseateles sp. YR242 TaxID=1855305 RepID=UPI0008D4ACB0|nr:RluA family pseudouridine synthase [Roseateles sp. YR242]SEL55705.1 23S rRNA pseudouridine1911/1915/1917 synthase [Roseateles sp. YR242]
MVQVSPTPAPGEVLYPAGTTPRESSGNIGDAASAHSPEDAPEDAQEDVPDLGAEAPERREAEAGVVEQGLRLDKWLVQLAPEFSRSHLQGLIDRGCVTLDGVVATQASRKPRLGQRLVLELQPTEEALAFRPEAMALDIVHEDEHLLVLQKPAGLVVHPAAGNWSGTLMNGLLAHHAGAATLPRAGIVHRLDKDTSGLMIVGKTLAAVTALVRMIAAREVHREYLALVHGRTPETWTVDAPIGRDPQSRTRMAVVGSGKPARTDFHQLAEAQWQDARGLSRTISVLHCVLHSGRTHQIRVHAAHKGHVLVSDALYGGAQALGLERQALHAARLSFSHPITGEPLRFQAPLPCEMAAAWELAGLPEPVF